MASEQKTKAIILKKQPLGEADEIITVFTEDYGKLRLLGKATKKNTSKLQFALQAFSEAELTLVHSKGSMHRVIRAVPLELFATARQIPAALAFFFWAAEVLLKSTPDEQPNQHLYQTLGACLRYANTQGVNQEGLDILVIKYSLDLLRSIGLTMYIPVEKSDGAWYFSETRGGFFSDNHSDSVSVSDSTRQFLAQVDAAALPNLPQAMPALPLARALTLGFLHYQIERSINAEQFL